MDGLQSAWLCSCVIVSCVHVLLPLHVHVLCHVCIANKVMNAKINIGLFSVHYNMFMIHKIVERYSKNNFEPMFMNFLSLLICYRRSRRQYQHYNSDLSHKPVILIQPLPICTKYTSFSDCLVRCLSVLSCHWPNLENRCNWLFAQHLQKQNI